MVIDNFADLNKTLITPFFNPSEMKMFKLLLSDKGAKKKKPGISYLRDVVSQLDGVELKMWVTGTLQKFRSLSDHASALKVLKEIGISTDYVPVIYVNEPWDQALQNVIKDVDIRDVMLPVPDCIMVLKHTDGVVYNVFLEQHGLEEQITIHLMSDDERSDDDANQILEALEPLITYSLLSFEIKLSSLNNHAGKNIVHTEDKDNLLNIDKSCEYKLTPVHKTKSSESAESVPTGRKVKFHIRRAHWRTYEDGKRIRIGWMFVGDISLGFVDKDYVI